MSVKNARVAIVYDGNKLRATPVEQGGWIRFPRHLRVEGAIYNVELLKEGAGGSWIATGEISPINKEAESAPGAPPRKISQKNQKNLPEPKPIPQLANLDTPIKTPFSDIQLYKFGHDQLLAELGHEPTHEEIEEFINNNKAMIAALFS